MVMSVATPEGLVLQQVVLRRSRLPIANRMTEPFQ
jgi:hypothetical protein